MGACNTFQDELSTLIAKNIETGEIISLSSLLEDVEEIYNNVIDERIQEEEIEEARRSLAEALVKYAKLVFADDLKGIDECDAYEAIISVEDDAQFLFSLLRV